jgi:hypothetical protein
MATEEMAGLSTRTELFVHLPSRERNSSASHEGRQLATWDEDGVIGEGGANATLFA